MKIRIAVLMAALVASGVALPANAAPKPKPKQVCNLITDVAGDTIIQGPQVALAGVDIVSADMVSDKTRLGVVIRVKNLAMPPDEMPDDLSFFTSKMYQMSFFLPGGKVRIGLAASLKPVTEEAQYHYGTATSPGTFVPQTDASGSINRVTNEISIWANIADLQKAGAVGTIKSGVRANQFRVETKAPTSWVSDQSSVDPKLSYTLGHPSCAKMG